MSAIEDLCRTVARLRAPDGCPWDREQDHRSLARCLVDECSELLDTIDRMDIPHMREELGDVLIQVVFHAQLAEERGDFDFEAVAREINDKLIRRHPHVFGGKRLSTSDEVLVVWEEVKAAEKSAKPLPVAVFKDMPPRLPAIMYAEAVDRQIEKKQLPAGGVVDGTRVEALAASMKPEEAGRRLYEMVAACRRLGVDPESALRREADRVRAAVAARVEAGAGNGAGGTGSP